MPVIDERVIIHQCETAVLVKWYHGSTWEYVIGWSPNYDSNGKVLSWGQGHYFGHDLLGAVNHYYLTYV